MAWVSAGAWGCCCWGDGRRRGDGARLQDSVDRLRTDETHKQETLEDSVRELGGLIEKLGGASGVGGGELFHGGKDVEELGGRKGVEGARDGVCASDARRERCASGQGRQRTSSSRRRVICAVSGRRIVVAVG